MTFRCVSRLQQEPLATPRNTHTQTGRNTWGEKRWGETGREKTTGKKKKKKKNNNNKGASAHTVTQRACQRHAGPNVSSEADNCQFNHRDFGISLAPGNPGPHVSQLTGPHMLAACRNELAELSDSSLTM